MRERQAPVDPAVARVAELRQIKFARGEQSLPQAPVDLVAVDIGVGIGIGAQRLALAQRVVEGAPVPQPHVIKQRLVLGEIDAAFLLRREIHRSRAMVDAVGGARRLDVPRDIGLLERQFIWTHVQAADQGRQHVVDRQHYQASQRDLASPYQH